MNRPIRGWTVAESFSEDHRLAGQGNYLLARIVAVANVSAIDGEDGFVARYDMPVGPIHAAIKYLAEQGIYVTYDGQILTHEPTGGEQ